MVKNEVADPLMITLSSNNVHNLRDFVVFEKTCFLCPIVWIIFHPTIYVMYSAISFLILSSKKKLFESIQDLKTH